MIIAVQSKGDVVPQSVLFKGYKVSGFAKKVDSYWWHIWYLVEKDGHFVRTWSCLVSRCSGGAAEAAAVIHGARAVDEWLE
jgi:hypothetical protein